MIGLGLAIRFATAETPATYPVPTPECYPHEVFLEKVKAAGLEPVIIGSNMRDGMTVVWMGDAGLAFSYTRNGSDITCTIANALNPRFDQKLIDRLQPPKKGA